MAHFRQETILAILIAWGGLVYSAAVLILLGKKWFMSLLRDVSVAADTKVRSLAESPRPMMYEALAQIRVRKVTLLARSARPDS